MRQAVVTGASIGGLLAARALHSSFDRVLVLDRDILPETAKARRGVPQSRQAHALLARGGAALDELFPGFLDEMRTAGVPEDDAHDGCQWYLDGYPMRRAPSPISVFGPTRPLLEHLIRERVRALPNVRIAAGSEVVGLLHDGRVRGVRTRRGEIAADIVVDAGGRASRFPLWLRDFGYGEVPTSTIRTDVVYMTRHYRAAPGVDVFAVVVTPYPTMPRSGVIIRQEGDRIVVLLAGMLGDEPPTDDAGILAFAESLPGTEIADFLRTAEPLDEPVRMRYPASVRYHYERLPRLPEGFLAIGDALCSFNPIYGQGVTVAALEAQVMAGITATDAKRYFAEAARLLRTPWSLAVGGDLRFPEVVGRRGVLDRVLNGYLTRYRAAASVDPALGAAFLRVSNMLAEPTHLLAPGRLLRVLRAAPRATPAPFGTAHIPYGPGCEINESR
ncbi:squalene monooxygenase [Actinoplanes sp. NPDC051851]|uniref:FAD-dependent oxidoreductase n=1 Tax=Actinoplanes sp. NPDC051851 TaxID=3154753 RepID=UPI0034442D12